MNSINSFSLALFDFSLFLDIIISYTCTRKFVLQTVSIINFHSLLFVCFCLSQNVTILSILQALLVLPISLACVSVSYNFYPLLFFSMKKRKSFKFKIKNSQIKVKRNFFILFHFVLFCFLCLCFTISIRFFL